MINQKIQWWLIAIPVILFLLPIPAIYAVIAAGAVGYFLYRQYNHVAGRKKLLETVDEYLKYGNLNCIEIEEQLEPYPDLRPMVTEKLRNWGIKQFEKFKDFDTLTEDSYIEDAINAIEFGAENSDELPPQIKQIQHRVDTIIESGFNKLIEEIKLANSLDGIIERYENIVCRTIFSYYSLYNNYASEAYETAIERMLELPLPTDPIELNCRFADMSFEDDDSSEDFEDCTVRITNESFVVKHSYGTVKVPHLKLKVEDKCFIFSPYKYEIEYESTDHRDDVIFKLRGEIIPLLEAIEQRFIENAKQIRDNVVTNTELLNPMRFNEPVANGRDCYYRGELLFSKKVAEDDSGDLAIIAPKKEVTVYLFDKTLEFVSQDEHASINIKDIMGMRINEYDDIFNIVRKGYSTPIGFQGDVLPLYKAIKALQARLLS